MNSVPEFGRDLLPRLEWSLRRLQPADLVIDGFRQAAVVVPLLKSADSWELLFTVRSSELSNHAGQISFPGGKVDAGETLEQAAVRELQEEVGLDVQRTLGCLSPVPSPAKYVVTPIVAVLDWPQPLKINPHEVAEVFTVPVQQLAQIEPRRESRTIQGVTRDILYYDYPQRVIWGLTGSIISELLQLARNAGSD